VQHPSKDSLTRTGIFRISHIERRMLTGSDLATFKVSFLLNCGGFGLMNNSIIPRCADKKLCFDIFIPKPHIKLLGVSHILNELIIRSSDTLGSR